MDYILLYHCTNKEKLYKISSKSVNKSNILNDAFLDNSKICIKSGSEDALVFIIKYINYYETDDEIMPPDCPLAENLNLKDIFELEDHIFGDLLYLIDTKKKKMFIKDMAEISQELNLDNLLKKIAAILAYNMQNLDSEEYLDL